MSNDTRISTQIQALQTDKTNIRQAILDKNGTCAEGNGFDDFATDIATIPSGITPTGSVSITENGTYDVTDKAQAVVNVSGGGGGTIAVLEGDVTWSGTYWYLDISHELGKAPIYAELTKTDSLTTNVIKWSLISRGLNIDGLTALGAVYKYYNGSGKVVTACPNSSGGYGSGLTSTLVRFGQGTSNQAYSGTYHYKIYYEA